MKTLCPPVTAGAGAVRPCPAGQHRARAVAPLLVLCGGVTLAVLALGFWAMTQK